MSDLNTIVSEERECSSSPRERISWATLWMTLAQTLKLRSPDPKVQVGAVLVSADNRIISTGYNGLPAGMNESAVDWADRPAVRERVLHAEVNCLVHAQSRFVNATMYVTTSPCQDCLKTIAAAGIKRVVYLDRFRDFQKVSGLASEFGITLTSTEEICAWPR